ncbi:MAG: class I SAM-dependent methyltransferase [Burkholderiales bacterium]
MSGFSTEWLALREPVDHRSRDSALQERLRDVLSQRAGAGARPLRILDLGCGAGSNLRALAPVLPGEQHWTLVDYDPALLRASRQTIAGWASRVLEDGERLTIDKGGRRIVIDFLQRDLARDFEPLLASAPDLVTAAALFDLVSSQWIVQFCDRVQSVFYTVLTYNGAERWTPPHAADADVLRAFHAHQTTDKGFGVAAGPGATQLLRDRLAARGFTVELAPSPWILGPQDRSLMQALCTGSAGAVSETGMVPQAVLSGWLETHRQATRCEIGHWDLLAVPSGMHVG